MPYFQYFAVIKEMRISAVADFRNPQPSGCGFFVVYNSVEYKHDI
jgi:hypothetical protein